MVIKLWPNESEELPTRTDPARADDASLHIRADESRHSAGWWVAKERRHQARISGARRVLDEQWRSKSPLASPNSHSKSMIYRSESRLTHSAGIFDHGQPCQRAQWKEAMRSRVRERLWTTRSGHCHLDPFRRASHSTAWSPMLSGCRARRLYDACHRN